MFYEVIPGIIFGKNRGALTYESDDSLAPGTIVEIPLGRKEAVGVVDKKVAQPDFPTKKISKILYSKPLPRHLLAAAKFIAEYYQAPLPAALGVILPAGIGRTGVKGSALSSSDRGGAKNRTKPNKTEQSEASAIPPNPINQRKTEQNSVKLAKTLKIPLIPLNDAQKKALEGLQKAENATKL